MEGETRVEAGCAAGGLAEGRSRSFGAAGRDVTGVAGTGLEEDLLARAGHCRSVVHGDLVGAGQECCMGAAEEHWRRGREEARC